MRAAARRLVGLYAVTPDVDDTPRLMAMVQAAIAGGARAIQYRHKRARRALRLEQAIALAAVCTAGRALLIVNDDAEVARDVGADGVHVGEDDGDVAAIRAIVGDGALIGVSCYDDLRRAHRAVDAGADYVAFGSVFASSVKPAARRAPLALFGEARTLGVPLVAIGGIDATNARSVIDAGADAIAVITDVFGPGEPAAIEASAARLVASLR